MIEKILEKFRKAGNIQFQRYAKPLIAVEDAIKIVEAVAKEYGKDTNVHTNAGRIRAMSDEELARFLADYKIDNIINEWCLHLCPDRKDGDCDCPYQSYETALGWLKSEAEE